METMIQHFSPKEKKERKKEETLKIYEPYVVIHFHNKWNNVHVEV